MTEQLLTMGSFLLGIPYRRNEGYLTLTMDGSGSDFPHAQILEWDGKALGDVDMVPWNAVALALLQSETGQQLIAVGETGEALRFANGGRFDERVPMESDRARARGPLRGARAIGREVYAVGMDCQAYRRSAAGVWQPIDATLRATHKVADVPGLEAVFGSDSSNVFAVGWRGTIVKFDGSAWQVQDSPVNTILTDGVQLDDGRVVACGRTGTIVVGDDDMWTTIEHNFAFIDFWGVAAIAQRIFLSSYNGLFELSIDDRTVLPVAIDMQPEPKTFGRIDCCADALWSVGAKDVLEFDGTNWSRVL